MNSRELAVLSSIKSNTQQSMLRTKEFPQTTKLNSKLASTIYAFLIGKIDYLPGYGIIDDLISNKESAISMGHGTMVYYRRNELIVEVEDMVTDERLRTDTITADKYFATICSLIPEGGGFTLPRKIDVKKNPFYNPKRVEYLQNYLAQYKDYKQEQGHHKGL